MGNFRNRITGTGVERIDNILFNPKNWRKHPKFQQDAIRGVLEEVGWVQNVLINSNTGNLIDGHLRVLIAAKNDEQEVPVVYVDLTQEEEDIILMSLDPIASMAETESEKLKELLSQIVTNNELINKMMERIAEEEGLNAIQSDGSLLSLIDITIADPKHKVNKGDIYHLDNHILAVEDVMRNWDKWIGYLEDGSILLPYAGVFVVFSENLKNHKYVIVQPDPYIAGHILDRYSEINGEESIRLK